MTVRNTACSLAAPPEVPPVPTPQAEPNFEREVAARARMFDAFDRLRGRDGRWRSDFKVRRRRSDGSVEPVSAGFEVVDARETGAAWMVRQERTTGRATTTRTLLSADRWIHWVIEVDGARLDRAQGFRIESKVTPGAWGQVASSIGFDVVTRLGAWALRDWYEPDGIAWMDSPDTVLIRPRRIRPGDPESTQRWRFRPGTAIPATVETWIVTAPPTRPARGRKPVGEGAPTVEYTFESVRGLPADRQPFPTALPPGCREIAVPDMPLPKGERLEPSVRRTIERWRRAWSRPLALSAAVDVAWRVEQRDTGNRNPPRIPEPYHGELWLRRPGKVRVEGAGGRGQLGFAVGDGERVSVRRTVPIQDPERPWTAMAAAGALDSGAYLDWFFGGPPDLSGMDSVGIADEPDPISGQRRRWLVAKSTRAPA
ncbi:MAG: hypothetical protein ACKO5K_08835, partial [Armatimonadota bacterium]